MKVAERARRRAQEESLILYGSDQSIEECGKEEESCWCQERGREPSPKKKKKEKRNCANRNSLPTSAKMTHLSV